MSEWTKEANRLLDAWAEATAEIRALHTIAAAHREKLTLANDKASAARSAFDTFMHGCMTVRADVITPVPTIDATTPPSAP